MEKKEVVIGMDQKMDFLKVHKHNSTMELLDINLANDMLQVITKPTRITQSSGTLIDNIYLSKGINTEYFSSILISELSDHLPCYVRLKLNKRKKKDMLEFKARNLDDSKILQVKQVLNGCDWQQLYNGSIDDAFGVYQKNLSEAIDKAAPEKVFRISGKQRIREPWMTLGIMKSRKNLDKKCKKIIGLGSQSDCVIEYKNYRNMLNRVKWKAKLSYYNDKFVEYENNASKLWQVVNQIIG